MFNSLPNKFKFKFKFKDYIKNNCSNSLIPLTGKPGFTSYKFDLTWTWLVFK